MRAATPEAAPALVGDPDALGVELRDDAGFPDEAVGAIVYDEALPERS